MVAHRRAWPASSKVIGFDMGGTSTDVSHFAGEFEREFETQVAGVRMRAPMMSIHTVAAGGGSILHFDGARFRVGPDCAGANPGPACYRRGGPLTVTDCNVMLGKIQPALLSARVRRRARDEPLDRDVVRAQLRRARRRDRSARPATPRAPEQVAEGFIEIAVGEHGQRDQEDLGAARARRDRLHARHASAAPAASTPACVADALGMTRVFVHPLAGVLSAYGMGLADQTRDARARARASPLDDTHAGGDAPRWTRCSPTPRAELEQQGVARARNRARCRVHLRYEGTDSALVVPFGALPDMLRRVRGGLPPALLVPDARSERWSSRRCRSRRRAAASAPLEARERAARQRADAPTPRSRCAMFSGGRVARRAALSARRRCAPGDVIDGPGDHRRGERHHGGRARLARERHARSTTWCSSASQPRADARARSAPQRRPGDARDLQQPVHVDRRADGPAPAEHRLLGEHQGAARLLVRAVRRRRQPDRQRAAHAGAPRLDERDRSRP